MGEEAGLGQVLVLKTRATVGRNHKDYEGLVRSYLISRVSQQTLDPMTARNQRSHLAGFIREVAGTAPQDLSIGQVERWMDSIRHLRPSTRRGHCSTVRCFCAWLVRTGVMDCNPTLDVPRPRLPEVPPRALSPVAMDKLFAACPDERATAIVWLMFGMGQRCCEVASLTFERWDRDGEAMRLIGKGSKERELPVPRDATAAVEAYLAEFPADGGPVIRSYRRPTQGLTPDALSGMVSEWIRAAGVKKAPLDGNSAHALRHTAASDTLEACGDVRVVQEMLGHSNLSTTSIYLRRVPLTRMRQAIEARYVDADDLTAS